MEILVIGKPAINIYLPLQEFPQEGDIFTINKKNESVGNIGATSACLLGKWKMSTHFTGVVGNDSYAEKIRLSFQENNVNIRYLETKYENPTSINYLVLNTKDGGSTRIIFNEADNQLTKYKYDFIPQFSIIDGTDFAGAQALLNNNSNCQTIFYGRVPDRDSINLAKRSTYVVCTEAFALGVGKVESIKSASDYVTLYQKIVDMSGNSNFVIILNNHKILYSVNGKVKMLPEMKINVVDYSSFDSVFTGALTYSIINNLELDDAIKFANTAAALSISKLGEVPSIPEIDEILDNSGLREKLGYAQSQNKVVEPTAVQPLQPEMPVQENVSQTENTFTNNEVGTQEPVTNTNMEVSFEQPIITENTQTSPNMETNPQNYEMPVANQMNPGQGVLETPYAPVNAGEQSQVMEQQTAPLQNQEVGVQQNYNAPATATQEVVTPQVSPVAPVAPTVPNPPIMDNGTVYQTQVEMYNGNANEGQQ